MFKKCKTNKRSRNLRKTGLQIVYQGQIIYSFEQLLEYDKSDFVHHINIQSLGIELFDAKNNLFTQIFNKLLQFRGINQRLQKQIHILEHKKL